MATVTERIQRGVPTFSVEFFPPKNDEGEATLWRTIRDLEPLDPAFVSVTYGAGGSSRDRTIRTTGRIATDTTLTAMAHLTAVDASLEDLRQVIGSYLAAGISNVLAIRGDPPGDKDADWVPHPAGLSYTEELVHMVRRLGDFCVGVAAFPYLHPRSVDEDTDTRYFIQKVKAGAEFAITQMFYDADQFLRMRDRIAAAGCEIPIMPGLMPVTTPRSAERGADFSGAPLPAAMLERLEPLAEDATGYREAGIDLCVELSQRMFDEGVENIHYISMNRSPAVVDVVQRLGIAARPGS
ncbi:methylenetetrahydrofolate reductase [NAD(P)H] [Actinomycetospora cinnamomea]|uniref:Methylenetetrahydrofolate reductase n=1 Tax=Actinomycetospora cinnamomea TaxID=663609 RepID=A0A2U1F9U1_9PSEU|nr:methylenetetrahydrofolate reductase [NAD(P)H] [Actinomycetospora cinnamomea]PVZ08934.1 5,10-methylenetetrahydrofolate reductase (NAD(P)) [Actinomycetospora cinnamomea]